MTDVVPDGLAAGIEERKRRWREFLSPGAKPGFLFFVRYPDPQDQASLTRARPIWRGHEPEGIERKWRAYQRACWRAAQVDDDWIPYLNMATGTEIFAEAFGCPVYLSDQSKFVRPRIHSPGEVASLGVPELSRSSLAYLFDMADDLQRRAGRKALFHLVDVQSPMDIAALIWEKAEFYMGMMDAPQAVHELSDKVRQLLAAFLDEWFGRYGSDFVAHFPDYFMSGGMTLSEDEVGAVNEDQFLEFFLPHLAALSQRYGGLGMHCCANAKHQWKHFRAIPGLRLLNLVNPPTRSPESYVKEAFGYFRDDFVQFHQKWTPDGPPETWPMKYPPGSRVVIEAPAADLASAQELARKLQAVRQRIG